MNKHLRARFGKLWSFPASVHASGNDEGSPFFEASSKTIVIVSMYTTISGICSGEMFCKITFKFISIGGIWHQI
jgi:hypothetical protein